MFKNILIYCKKKRKMIFYIKIIINFIKNTVRTCAIYSLFFIIRSKIVSMRVEINRYVRLVTSGAEGDIPSHIATLHLVGNRVQRLRPAFAIHDVYAYDVTTVSRIPCVKEGLR